MPQIQPESQIFCDMDGVLVDFQAAAIEMLNDILDGHPPRYAPMSAKNKLRLQRVKDEKGAKWRASKASDLKIQAVKNLMFAIIGSNPGAAYAEMPANMDGVNELWSFLNSTGHQVNLLSAPIGTKNHAALSSEEGKRIWAERLSPAPSEIIITPATQKPQYATASGVPNILIDDRASTIATWNAAGGIAVLHIPKQSDATIRQLRELGL